MAANSKSRGIASLGKRVVKQIRTAHSLPALSSAPLTTERATYSILYEKNPDDQIISSEVPEDVIQSHSDKYWAPHPQTGVFAPATNSAATAGGDRSFQSSSATKAGANSVLEVKAWFRTTSLEDLEKPYLQP